MYIFFIFIKLFSRSLLLNLNKFSNFVKSKSNNLLQNYILQFNNDAILKEITNEKIWNIVDN